MGADEVVVSVELDVVSVIECFEVMHVAHELLTSRLEAVKFIDDLVALTHEGVGVTSFDLVERVGTASDVGAIFRSSCVDGNVVRSGRLWPGTLFDRRGFFGELAVGSACN